MFVNWLLERITAPGISYNYINRFKINRRVKNITITSYNDMVKILKKIDKSTEHVNLDIIGKSVKGRYIYIVKFGAYNPENPTVLIMTQQHGNEALPTEGALNFIKKMSLLNKKVKDLINKVNILVVPRLNVDGAEGDVNFNINSCISGNPTRENANGIDLNRDHLYKTQPEIRAIYKNVFEKYKIDYAVDLHQQHYDGISMLYPTNKEVKPNVDIESKKLGAIIYEANYGNVVGEVCKYPGGIDKAIARNYIAYKYDIATILFEITGIVDYTNPNYLKDKKQYPNIIKQSEITIESVIKSIANGDIKNIDIKIWDTLCEASCRNK